MSRGALPTFGKIGRSVITCLHPSYSPTRVGNTAQALAYLAKSPAARAASA
jgi:predicted metal-dependent hydrolase